MMTHNTPYYRTDIDGLRAIAVFLVIGFHAFPSFFGGGFIGVDIFFVISGFLITGILLREIEHNTFRLHSFYARRIKRLFPALMITFLMVLGYGWLVLLGDEFSSLGKHTFFGASFLSNFTLLKETGYFDTVATHKPFLHLWSLAIEEQYYIIWPIALYVFTRSRLKPYLGWCIGLSLVISLFVSMTFAVDIIMNKKRMALSFYTPPARFWELSLGSFLAYWMKFRQGWFEKGYQTVRGWFQYLPWSFENACASIGISIIFFSLFYMSTDDLYPGWRALLPTAGTFCCLLAGSQNWFAKQVLSKKALVSIGLISYPLYLLHWPAFSFVHIINPEILNNAGVKITLLLIVALISFGIYRWVEKPVRSSSHSVALILIVMMMGLAWQGYRAYQKQWLPAMAKNSHWQTVMAAIGEWEYPGELTQFPYQGFDFYQQRAGKKAVVVLGDSNVQQYAPRVIQLYKEHGTHMKTVIFAAKASWPPIPNLHSDNYPAYEGMMKVVQALIAEPFVSDVIIGAQWLGYFTDNKAGTAYYYRNGRIREPLLKGSIGFLKAANDLKAFINEIQAKGKQVVLLTNLPIGSNCDPKTWFVRRDFLGRVDYQVKPLERTQWKKNSALTTRLLTRIATETGAKLIRPEDTLCDEQRCQVVTEQGTPLYMDSLHLRPSFVRDRITYLDPILLDDF